MKKIQYKIILGCIIACFTLMTSCQKDMETMNPKEPEIVVPEGAEQGEIFIKFRPEASEQLDKNLLKNARESSLLKRSSLKAVDAILERVGVQQIERVFPIDNRYENRTRNSQLHLWYLVRFDPETDLLQFAEELSKVGELSGIQFNHKIKRAYNTANKPVYLSEIAKNTHSSKNNTLTNDPYLHKQWGLVNNADAEFKHLTAGADINCKSAWQKNSGDPSIIVAVLDEGVMYTHEDLQANMWVNENETDVTSLTDHDGNGYAGDRYGYNFVRNSGYISWNKVYDTGHGTHVAGVVAAAGNNGKGIAGVAGGNSESGESGVKIMSCQLFDGNRAASLLQEVKAIKYAADNGAVILQCSWGYNSGYANGMTFAPSFKTDEEWIESASLEKDALDYFVHHAGSPNGVIDGGIVVFAAGNELAPMASYPGAHENYISVAATAADYTPAYYTNYGRRVDISAPGGDMQYHCSAEGGILSTIPYIPGDAEERRYAFMDGTSMACPAVSGVAALGLSYAVKQRKHFTSEEFQQLLIESSYEMTYPAEKIYYMNWDTEGDVYPTEMDLSLYKGTVGGMIDAGKLLDAIDDDENGRPMRVPNLYLAVEGSQKIDLARFFKNGENLSYSFKIEDNSVASVQQNASIVNISGLKNGSTKAVVTATGFDSQTIYITVRENASDNWLKNTQVK